MEGLLEVHLVFIADRGGSPCLGELDEVSAAVVQVLPGQIESAGTLNAFLLVSVTVKASRAV